MSNYWLKKDKFLETLLEATQDTVLMAMYDDNKFIVFFPDTRYTFEEVKNSVNLQGMKLYSRNHHRSFVGQCVQNSLAHLLVWNYIIERGSRFGVEREMEYDLQRKKLYSDAFFVLGLEKYVK